MMYGSGKGFDMPSKLLIICGERGLISAYELKSTDTYLKSPSSLIDILSKLHMHLWMRHDGSDHELSRGRIYLSPGACHEVNQVRRTTVGWEENCIVGKHFHG